MLFLRVDMEGIFDLKKKKKEMGKEVTSLVVHWLRLRALNARGPGSIPGLRSRSQMLQLRLSSGK